MCVVLLFSLFLPHSVIILITYWCLIHIIYLLSTWSIVISLCVCVVKCKKLSIGNGTIKCSFEDNEIPSYKDTCDVTCNSGFAFTYNDTKITCQSSGNWSSTDIECKNGEKYIRYPLPYFIELCWTLEQ